MDGVTREMPRYLCHKQVHALKIAEIHPNPNPDPTGMSAAAAYGAWIVPADPDDKGYPQIEVSAEYMMRHRPEVGGYYVIYADGYTSYSPAKAFEDGYALVQDGPSSEGRIKGYRALSDDEKTLINEVKAEGERLRDLVDRVDRHIQQPGGPSVHPVTTSPARWLAEGRTDLQKGLMCLTRAVAAPTTF